MSELYCGIHNYLWCFTKYICQTLPTLFILPYFHLYQYALVCTKKIYILLVGFISWIYILGCIFLISMWESNTSLSQRKDCCIFDGVIGIGFRKLRKNNLLTIIRWKFSLGWISFCWCHWCKEEPLNIKIWIQC